ncbi:MAG: RlmE family RNA methyltransferase [Pseudomonadales bacterium]|nr:RlmE family RNA methyltransferase [Pseudomonadales bacterium]
MKKSKSSQQWLKNHIDDEYVKRAQAAGFRSRASFKLLEIDSKFSLLARGSCVVDLGAAPGGWCQVATQKLGNQGKVIALDILAMDPLQGVHFIQGDFTLDEPFETLLAETSNLDVDLVISDMAPNLSGMSQIDQPKSAYLVELALHFSEQVLKKNGNLVTKCFEGAGINDIRREFGQRFSKVLQFKPKASRSKSKEFYLIGLGHKHQPARNIHVC